VVGSGVAGDDDVTVPDLLAQRAGCGHGVNLSGGSLNCLRMWDMVPTRWTA
jgi:hypothetical protein